MNVIFYQNILSMHQSAYIRALANRVERVVLVVDKEMIEEREKQKWNIPDFGKTEIIITPGSAQIDTLANIPNAIHIFSGLDNPNIDKIAKKVKPKDDLKIGVFTESFRYNEVIGIFRYIKYFLLFIKQKKKIDFILTAGSIAYRQFKRIGFEEGKLYNWAYITEYVNNSIECDNSLHSKASLLFVGSIDDRKNIMNLIAVCNKLKRNSFTLKIIGRGPLENDMFEAIKSNSDITYIGVIDNKEISSYMESADLLILPSKYDGWGAVVNEALMCGLPVLASNHCGAKDLLKDGRGRIFSIEENNLEQVLFDFIKELPYTNEKREEIKRWARGNISGEAAAEYLIEIIDYVENGGVKPEAPWL
ncbi:MAG: glycosyltransferase family 4 protein [Dysgonomonas sp.]